MHEKGPAIINYVPTQKASTLNVDLFVSVDKITIIVLRRWLVLMKSGPAVVPTLHFAGFQ